MSLGRPGVGPCWGPGPTDRIYAPTWLAGVLRQVAQVRANVEAAGRDWTVLGLRPRVVRCLYTAEANAIAATGREHLFRRQCDDARRGLPLD